MENFLDKIITWGTNTGIKIVVAIAVLLVSFRIITVVARRLEKKAAKREKLDKTLTKTLLYAGKIAAKILVVICLVGYLGIDTSGLTAVITSLGVCVGLAVNGALANLAGGILILITRPFKVDDYISVAGFEGTVQDIFIINTKIKTIDDKIVYLPNGTISTSPVTNYTETGMRRIDHVISIGYKEDFEKAQAIILDILDKNEKVLKTPAPDCRMLEHGESAIKLTCRPWVKSSDYWDVYFETLEAIKKAFDEEKINIPYSQVDVHVHND